MDRGKGSFYPALGRCDQLLKPFGQGDCRKGYVIIGRSNVYREAMASARFSGRNGSNYGCTLQNEVSLADVTREGQDILIVAIGKERFITSDYVKKGAVVIDVGMHRDAENHLCGDVDFADVEPVASAITPVPGGVGPMTIAMLMNNCVETVRS